MFASPSGNELSLEPPGLTNGAVLDGMLAKVARPGNQRITLFDPSTFISLAVHDPTHGSQHPLIATPHTVPDIRWGWCTDA